MVEGTSRTQINEKAKGAKKKKDVSNNRMRKAISHLVC